MSRSFNSRKGSYTHHRSCMGHKISSGKYQVGIGGINCPCCVIDSSHKKMQRKWERRTDNHEIRNNLDDFNGDLALSEWD